MQDAQRLPGARIDRRAGADEIVADLEEFDPEMGNRRVDVDGGQVLDGDGLFPDRVQDALSRTWKMLPSSLFTAAHNAPLEPRARGDGGAK